MILVCPDCKGSEDRPFDRCPMCSDPGCWSEVCDHERLERFNADCDCTEACADCGAELDGTDCSRCGIEDAEDRDLELGSGLL